MCNNDLCTVQDQVCTLLGIQGTAVDDKIEIIIDSVANRLKNLLGGVSIIPQQLMYIVTEVSVIRFNRIGSEGMSSHSVEGESISFSDNDFAGFMDEIEAYLDEQKGTKRGRVRFL